MYRVAKSVRRSLLYPSYFLSVPEKRLKREQDDNDDDTPFLHFSLFARLHSFLKSEGNLAARVGGRVRYEDADHHCKAPINDRCVNT
jgi:hypothetical protein